MNSEKTYDKRSKIIFIGNIIEKKWVLDLFFFSYTLLYKSIDKKHTLKAEILVQDDFKT